MTFVDVKKRKVEENELKSDSKKRDKFLAGVYMPKKVWKGAEKMVEWAKNIDFEPIENKKVKEGDYKEMSIKMKELEAREKELNAELLGIHKEKIIVNWELMETPEMKKAYKDAYCKVKADLIDSGNDEGD